MGVWSQSQGGHWRLCEHYKYKTLQIHGFHEHTVLQTQRFHITWQENDF